MRLCCGLIAVRSLSADRSARRATAGKVGRPLAGAWVAVRSTTWQDEHQRLAISRPCSASCAAASAGTKASVQARVRSMVGSSQPPSRPLRKLEAVGMKGPVAEVPCLGELYDGAFDRLLRGAVVELDPRLRRLEGMALGIDQILEEGNNVVAHVAAPVGADGGQAAWARGTGSHSARVAISSIAARNRQRRSLAVWIMSTSFSEPMVAAGSTAVISTMPWRRSRMTRLLSSIGPISSLVDRAAFFAKRRLQALRIT